MKRENRKKEEGKLMGIVNMVIWLFAGFVAVGAAAVVYYLNKNSGKKKEGERTSVVIPRSPASGNFPAREDCWKKYKQMSYEKKYTQCCKNVFTETSILFYLEKLFTTAHYELKNQ